MILKEIIYLLEDAKKQIYFFICFNVCKFIFRDVKYIFNFPALNGIFNEKYFIN